MEINFQIVGGLIAEDPRELNNVYHDPAYAAIVKQLKDELHELQKKFGDHPEEEID